MLKAVFYSIFICLSATFLEGRLFASDYYSNALRIYSEGRFFEASIEFERAIYYENDSSMISKCKYYKSLCYKSLGDYSRAIEELKNINTHVIPDSLYILVGYEHALCLFLNNDFDNAFLKIEEIKLKTMDTLKFMSVIPLNIFLLNASGKWDEALSFWHYIIRNSVLQDSTRKLLNKELNRLYDKKRIPKLYSAMKAERLSSIIPGSGQIYCGAIGEGSFNFIINVSLLGFSIWELYTEFYFTGYFVGLRLFNKFYSGGMRRAGMLAKGKNIEEIKKFNYENSNLMVSILKGRITDSQ